MPSRNPDTQQESQHPLQHLPNIHPNTQQESQDPAGIPTPILVPRGNAGIQQFPSPTFSSPTSLLGASMASSSSGPGARGQRVTLEGNFTLWVSCSSQSLTPGVACA